MPIHPKDCRLPLAHFIFCFIMKTSIYIKRFVSLSVSLSVTFCLSPGDKQFVCPPGTNISYTQERGGTNISHTQEGGGTNIFHTQGGDKHFYIEGGGQTFLLGGGIFFYDVAEETDMTKRTSL